MAEYQSRLVREDTPTSQTPQAFASLADRLHAFSNKQQDILDVQMQKKAKQKGLTDAQGKTEITLRTGETIADEAWNAGAKTSHYAALKVDMADNLERISAENPDPEVFAEVAKGYGSGLLEGVPEEMRPAVQDDLASNILRGTVTARKNQRSEQQAANKITSANALEVIEGDGLDAADNLDVDEIELRQQEYNTIVDGQVASGAFSPAEGIKLKAEFDERIEDQLILGQFKQSLAAGEDEDFLKRFSGKKMGKLVSPEKREQLLVKMLSFRSRRNSIDAIKKKEGMGEINLYTKALANGFETSKEETARISAIAKDLDVSEEFNTSVSNIKTIAEYGKAPAVARRAKIAEYAVGGNLDDYTKWKALKEADATITAAAQKDGYALAVKQGIIEATPIDYTNPTTFEARSLQSKHLSQHYGVEVSPFTDIEINQMIEGTKEMTPQELSMLSASIGAMGNRKVLTEIAKKKEPIFAMMAAIGDLQVSETVFTGQRELDLDNVKLPAGEDKNLMMSDAHDYLRNVYTGEDLQAVRESAQAHYAATNGNQPYDDDKWRDSLDAITGGIGTFNGYSVELPRGVEPDVMEDFIDDFSPEAVVEIGGVDNRSDVDAAKMIRNGIWRSEGSNLYSVLTPFGELMQDGKPLRISYDVKLTPTGTLSFEEYMERRGVEAK